MADHRNKYLLSLKIELYTKFNYDSTQNNVYIKVSLIDKIKRKAESLSFWYLKICPYLEYHIFTKKAIHSFLFWYRWFYSWQNTLSWVTSYLPTFFIFFSCRLIWSYILPYFLIFSTYIWWFERLEICST